MGYKQQQWRLDLGYSKGSAVKVHFTESVNMENHCEVQGISSIFHQVSKQVKLVWSVHGQWIWGHQRSNIHSRMSGSESLQFILAWVNKTATWESAMGKNSVYIVVSDLHDRCGFFLQSLWPLLNEQSRRPCISLSRNWKAGKTCHMKITGFIFWSNIYVIFLIASMVFPW